MIRFAWGFAMVMKMCLKLKLLYFYNFRVFQDQQDPKVNVGALVGLAKKASQEISVSEVTLVNQESPANLGDQGLQVHLGIKAQQVLQDHLASGEKRESR